MPGWLGVLAHFGPGRLFRRARVVFFCCGPARTLTHSLRAWAAMPPAGVFFFAAAPPGPGWCLFFCCGPARTLTHSRWAGAISARPGLCLFFFFCGPAEPGEPITKNVWCTTSGLKRPAGHSKKKTPLPHHANLGGEYLRPKKWIHGGRAGAPYIYIYTHTHTYTHTYVYVCMYVNIYIRVCVCLYVCKYACMLIHIFVYLCIESVCVFATYLLLALT